MGFEMPPLPEKGKRYGLNGPLEDVTPEEARRRQIAAVEADAKLRDEPSAPNGEWVNETPEEARARQIARMERKADSINSDFSDKRTLMDKLLRRNKATLETVAREEAEAEAKLRAEHPELFKGK